jgi:nicotinamide riboside transporter PnuC
MTNRSPFAVFVFAIITIGIYSWYWLVKTKGELNQRGATIPTAWIWLIPFVGGILWLYRYAEGVEKVSGGRKTTTAAFLWMFFLGAIGQAVMQGTYNELT